MRRWRGYAASAAGLVPASIVEPLQVASPFARYLTVAVVLNPRLRPRQPASTANVIRYVFLPVVPGVKRVGSRAERVSHMTITSARPDLAAYRDALTMATADLVHALRDLLGSKLVAYLGGVKETRAVRQWVEGTRDVGKPDDLERLRLAYRAARIIVERDSAHVAQSWFQGLNPLLDDRSPARLLREGDLEADGARVIAAARQFAAVG